MREVVPPRFVFSCIEHASIHLGNGHTYPTAAHKPEQVIPFRCQWPCNPIAAPQPSSFKPFFPLISLLYRKTRAQTPRWGKNRNPGAAGVSAKLLLNSSLPQLFSLMHFLPLFVNFSIYHKKARK